MKYHMELRNAATQEKVTVRLTDPMLYDRLLTLSAEYDVPVELLVNIAVKKLLDDVALVRQLRNGQAGG